MTTEISTKNDDLMAFKEVFAKLRADNEERKSACDSAVPAVDRLVRIMGNKTGQSYKLRALLYSLYNGQPTSLLEVVCLDWRIRKDFCSVLLAFGFEDSDTNFFYNASNQPSKTRACGVGLSKLIILRIRCEWRII
jgi:hypothetical protein